MSEFMFDDDVIYSALNVTRLEAGDVLAVTNAPEDIRDKNHAVGALKRKTLHIVEFEAESIYSNTQRLLVKFPEGNYEKYNYARLIAKHNDLYKPFKVASAEGKTIWCKDATGCWFEVSGLPSYDLPVSFYSLDPDAEPVQSQSEESVLEVLDTNIKNESITVASVLDRLPFAKVIDHLFDSKDNLAVVLTDFKSEVAEYLLDNPESFHNLIQAAVNNHNTDISDLIDIIGYDDVVEYILSSSSLDDVASNMPRRDVSSWVLDYLTSELL